MNINMNMYPNVMNIDMGGFNHNINGTISNNVSAGSYYSLVGTK